MINSTQLTLAILTLCFCFVSSGHSETRISVWDKNLSLPHNKVFLDLAIEKASSKYGEVTLVPSPPMDQTQAFSALMADDSIIDIAIGGLSSEREQTLLPIYVPTDRGLLGFRICLINPDSQALFDKVRTPRDFEALGIDVGIGEHWPDAAVLKYNNIPIRTASTNQQLIELLRKDDIACFSRGLNELTEEMARLADLVPEQRIVLIYPMADLIFARRSAVNIHEILNYGLQVAVEDGSFAALFAQQFGDALDVFSIYKRKLMFLDNPDLSEQGREAINRLGIASFTGVIQ